MPDWIKGVWSNTACSDVNETVVFAFEDAHCFFGEGVLAEQEDLFERFADHELLFSSGPDHLVMRFVMEADTVMHVFEKAMVRGEQALLWDIRRKGQKKGFLSEDSNLVLRKVAD